MLLGTPYQTDISFQFPWTRKFYESPGFKNVKEAIALRDTYIRKRVEEHERKYNPDDVGDFCDFLLKSLHEEKEHWREVGTESEIRDHMEMILANMILAGSDTSA